jgi:phospholipid transport system transporter-binding protein
MSKHAFSFKAAAGQGCFDLAGELNFETVPVVLQDSVNLFSNAAQIDVDLAGVTQANSAGLSLLIEWKAVAKEQNKDIHYHNIPAQLLSLAKVCKAEQFL